MTSHFAHRKSSVLSRYRFMAQFGHEIVTDDVKIVSLFAQVLPFLT